MSTPADVLATINRTDSAAPRITCYDDLTGPTTGERVELSARVLGTWVNKAANALQEEWDLEPGSVVHLGMQPHWRLLYWAWAVWSVGAVVDLDGSAAPDLVVTDDPDRLPDGGTAVLVTRAALARRATTQVPDGVMDEAADLSSHGDLFTAWAEPENDDPALRVDGQQFTYGTILDAWAAQVTVAHGARVQLVDPSGAELLRGALATWAAGGSLVVHLGAPSAHALAHRALTEGVTG